MIKIEPELIRILISQTLPNKHIDAITVALTKKSPISISALWKNINASEISIGSFYQSVVLMFNRGLIRLNFKDDITSVELNYEKIKLLVYKNFLLEMILTKMNDSSCAIIERMIANHFISKNQLLSNFTYADKLFKNSYFDKDQFETNFNRLCEEGYIVSYQDKEIHFSTEEGIEEVTNKQVMADPRNELKTLNLLKLYHYVRTLKFENFVTSEVSPSIALINTAILRQSNLFGKCGVIKTSEKIKIKAIKEWILTHSSSNMKSSKVLEDLSRINTINHCYLNIDDVQEEISVNLLELSNDIKINGIEDHILNNFSKNHVRVLRAITILKLKSLASLDETLLLTKTDLRLILNDLEKINVVKRIHFHESVEVFEYVENIREFVDEFAVNLFKIVLNLHLVKQKKINEGLDENCEEAKLWNLKVETAISAIAKNIFVFLEI